MTTRNDALSELLNDFASHESVTKKAHESVTREHAEYVKRIAPIQRELDESYRAIELQVAYFFAHDAKLEMFFSWETAAPLYRMGWCDGRVSPAFEAGFATLLIDADTYIKPAVGGWNSDPKDMAMVRPFKHFIVEIPRFIDDKKMAWTATVLENVFAPTTEAYMGAYVNVWLDEPPHYTQDTASIRRRSHGDYELSWDGMGKPGEFNLVGSMAEIFQHIGSVYSKG